MVILNVEYRNAFPYIFRKFIQIVKLGKCYGNLFFGIIDKTSKLDRVIRNFSGIIS